MKEVVQVKLENEMDLILAHKRAMKLCELTGLSLINQTSIATAVSEIARCAIDHGTNARLSLGVDSLGGKKFLKAVIRDTTDFSSKSLEACTYAKRLVDEIETTKSSREIQISLKHQINFAGTLTDARIESFVEYFRQEPPLSPYDEIRRKNVLLQDLAEKLKDSETDYRTLTDSLPLMMFSANNRGVITYTNKWSQDFLGASPKELGHSNWQNFIHPNDYSSFTKELNLSLLKQSHFNGQYRFKERVSGSYIWHMISVIPLKNEKDIVIRWIGFIVDINGQKVAEQTLKDNRELKETQQQLFQNQEELQQKVVELNRSNYELEQFAHLASHDLQEPLRKLFFYSDVLKKKYAQLIDESGLSMLSNMTMAAGRMKELINDLLSYSQLQQQKLDFEMVDLNKVMQEIIKDFDITIREKNATIKVDDLPTIKGNTLRIRQLFANLVSNSLKYSRADVPPVIEIAAAPANEHVAISVRDNGIGFEEEYKEKIFGLFERLHTRDRFPGTGIGLSICKKIVELHNGKVSATSIPGEYALFEVTLPLTEEVTILTV
jgi:PAS domain S-box-containing protein